MSDMKVIEELRSMVVFLIDPSLNGTSKLNSLGNSEKTAVKLLNRSFNLLQAISVRMTFGEKKSSVV